MRRIRCDLPLQDSTYLVLADSLAEQFNSIHEKMIINRFVKTFYNTFRGKVVLNHTISFDMKTPCNQILEDQTTTDALLLAQISSIIRLYPNGTVEDIVGDKDKEGFVITEYIYAIVTSQL